MIEYRRAVATLHLIPESGIREKKKGWILLLGLFLTFLAIMVLLFLFAKTPYAATIRSLEESADRQTGSLNLGTGQDGHQDEEEDESAGVIVMFKEEDNLTEPKVKRKLAWSMPACR